MSTLENKTISIKELYQNVVQYLNKNQYSNAKQYLERVPKEVLWSSPALLNALGIAYRGLGQPQASIRYYLKALKIESSSGTWANLGNAYKDANMINSAIRAHKESINISETPNATQWHNYGLALSIAGQHRSAIIAFEKSLNLDPAQLGVKWDLARSQLYIGNYEEGFNNYQFRWSMKDAPPKRVHGREWQGQLLQGEQSLYVYAEQGFGDYIQCVRYLVALKKVVKNLKVEVKTELRELMELSFPDINFINYQSSVVDLSDSWVVSLLDLPKYFPNQHFLAASGYLKFPQINNNSILKILNQYSRYKNVGVVWGGSLTFKRNKYRSSTVESFVDNFNSPHVQLHSLQIGPLAKDADKFPSELLSRELSSNIASFADTAQIIKNLDLVISTCTSMVHLCGALGVPCWVLLDYSAHWLWGDHGDRSAWYESLRFFRQPAPGDWRSVFDQASVALLDWSQS